MNQGENHRVSVIIVHYGGGDRSVLLEKCIDMLSKQTFNDFELIIVADNLSNLSESTLKKIDGIDVKLDLSINKRGAAWCRKIGVDISSCKHVAFIDDDAIPEKTWLKNIYQRIINSNFVGVGGKTLSFNPVTLVQKFADVDGSQRLPLVNKEGEIFNISTVNACFLREALIKSGVIHEAYIEQARKRNFFFFEDYDITYRLIQLYGVKSLCVAQNAIVYHNHRDTMRSAFKQFEGYGKGASFWLSAYKKQSSDLRGGQNLPKKLNSFFGHLYQVVLSIPSYTAHYKRARKNNKSIVFSILFAVYGWLLRLAFHKGVYKTSNFLDSYN